MNSSVDKLSIPASLIQHLREKISLSVQIGAQESNIRVQVVENIITKLLCDTNVNTNNKTFLESGTCIAKYLRLNLHIVPTLVNIDNIDLSNMLEQYQEYIKANNRVFTDITEHHNSLGSVDWNTVANNESALATYSTAAEQMGDRLWVQKGNDWMKQFTIQFYTEGGAKKHYLRVLRARYQTEHGVEMSNEESIKHNDSLIRNLLVDINGVQDRKIRLLDVGSCYNPLASDNDNLFDITALDLYPAHPSVLHCDFLNLSVGSATSDPVTVAPTSSTPFLPDTKLDPSQMTKLLQLPAGSFEVITMSLVLNYLPTPTHRELMIAKARELLISPNYNNQCHHRGLLLIVEKHSIFGKDKVDRPDLWCAGKGALLKNFKQTICNLGFELVKYREMEPVNGKRSHLFAFATIDVPTDTLKEQSQLLIQQLNYSNGMGNAVMRDDSGTLLPRLWIKQDFDAALYGTVDNKPVVDQPDVKTYKKRERESEISDV